MSNQKIKALVAIVAFAVAVLLIGRAMHNDRIRGAAPQVAWFYDLKSDSLFMAASDLIPPIGIPSDPESADGMRAYVYTCGSCDQANRQVLYIERYSEAAKQTLATINTVKDEQQKAALWQKVIGGQLVAQVPASGQEPTWVPISSEAGSALAKAFWTMCDGEQRGTLCSPQ